MLSIKERRAPLLVPLRPGRSSLLKFKVWDESQHPRVPAGQGDPSGEFTEAGGAWAGSFSQQVQSKLPEYVQQDIRGTLDELMKQYPSLADVEVDDGKDKWEDISGFHVGVESPVAFVLVSEKGHTIYVNPKKLGDYAFMDKYAKEWNGCVVSPTLKGLIIHESGHVLAMQAEKRMGSRKFDALLLKYNDDPDRPNSPTVSPYGQENRNEFMAETFSAHYLNRTAGETPFSKQQLETAHAIWGELDKVLKKP